MKLSTNFFLLNKTEEKNGMSDMSDDFLAFYINTHPAPQSIIKEIIKPETHYGGKNRCEWCNKPLSRRYKTHKNVCQEPIERKFCSRECKEKWCYEKQRK